MNNLALLTSAATLVCEAAVPVITSPWSSKRQRCSHNKPPLRFTNAPAIIQIPKKKDVFQVLASEYNKYDVPNFRLLVTHMCCEDVITTIGSMGVPTKSVSLFLMLWELLFEAFPDGAIAPLRIRMISKNSVEYKFRYSGTRITCESVESLYMQLLKIIVTTGAMFSNHDLLKFVSASCVDRVTANNTEPHMPAQLGSFVSVKAQMIFTYNSAGFVTRVFVDLQV